MPSSQASRQLVPRLRVEVLGVERQQNAAAETNPHAQAYKLPAKWSDYAYQTEAEHAEFVSIKFPVVS